MDGPVLLHVITKKGKGYSPAEDDKIGTWHGTGPYKIETGDFVKSSSVHHHGVDLWQIRFRKLHVKIDESSQ